MFPPTAERPPIYLHGHQAILDENLLGQEIGSDSGLVLVAELFVHILVHQGRLSHSIEGSSTQQQEKSKGVDTGQSPRDHFQEPKKEDVRTSSAGSVSCLVAHGAFKRTGSGRSRDHDQGAMPL